MDGAAAGPPKRTGDEDEIYLLFRKGKQTLRVLITRAASATDVVVLSRSAK
jgi:hypothetical protein